MKWQEYGKRAALAHDTADFDAAVMIFHDTVGKREAKTGAIAFGGVERPENVGQVLRGDAAAGVADHHAGITVSRPDLDPTVPGPSMAWTAFRSRFRSTW